MHCNELNGLITDGDIYSFSDVAAAYDVSERIEANPRLYELYKFTISNAIDNYEATTKTKLAILTIEPLLIGAGGMLFPDPLYQKALVETSKERNIPVIFDEVAAGLYRLGVRSAGTILKETPDVACYAKLLSGGVLPMAVTVSTYESFDSFVGGKSDALLHGHSYTAAPAACNAAVEGVQRLENERRFEFEREKKNEKKGHPLLAGVEKVVDVDYGKIQTHKFNEEYVKFLSMHKTVTQAFSLGTVLAVTVQRSTPIIDETKKVENYNSSPNSLSSKIVSRLRLKGIYARPLGDVVYIMVSPLVSKEEANSIIDKLSEAIVEEESCVVNNALDEKNWGDVVV